jgi:hypothetical protein
MSTEPRHTNTEKKTKCSHGSGRKALSASVDRCEEKAFDMAWKGDGQLLQFILKAHRPSVYRERSEVAVAAGVIILPAKSDGSE